MWVTRKLITYKFNGPNKIDVVHYEYNCVSLDTTSILSGDFPWFTEQTDTLL